MFTGTQGLVQKAAGCMDGDPRERAGLEVGGHVRPSELCPGSALVLSVHSLTGWPEGSGPNAPRVAVSHTFPAQVRCTSTFSSLCLERSCPTLPLWLLTHLLQVFAQRSPKQDFQTAAHLPLHPGTL